MVDTDYFGIGLVTIINSTDVEFKYIRTSSGEVYDSFILKNIIKFNLLLFFKIKHFELIDLILVYID